jgi:hypothetical protein
VTRTDRVTTIVALGTAIGLAIHGEITDRGVGGWLNYLQQSLFGSYYFEVSLLVLVVGLTAAGAAVSALLTRVLGPGQRAARPRSDRHSSAPSPPAARRTRRWIFAAMIAATWIVGLAFYGCHASQLRRDATASYQRLALTDDAPAPRPSGSHVALRGRWLTEQTIVHRTGDREDFTLVPVVAPHWQPGTPVTFVAKVHSVSDLPGTRRSRAMTVSGEEDEALLARLDGAVPVAAAQLLARAGVPLTEPSYLLHVVPSLHGAATVGDTSAEDRWLLTVACGGMTLILGIFFVVAQRADRARAP